MTTAISLRMPNVDSSPELAGDFVESIGRIAELAPADVAALARATSTLVAFALEHAYAPGADGELAVETHLFDGGVRIDVHDWGLPLELHRGGAASVLAIPGLDVGHLVDEATFQNLGRDGKLFSVVKHCSHRAKVRAAPLVSDHDDHETARAAADVEVRAFAPGDEEAICQLVYRNYANTYGSEFFYVPERLLERNEAGDVVSTVAVVDGQVVGHHALLFEGVAGLAETGAAVIHPEFKGLGIFNVLSLQTLEHARARGLAAVWMQAVTIHPYTQKAAFSHGYRATAVAVGRARGSIRLEGNELTRTGKRHGIVVDHLCFDSVPRNLHLPAVYREQLEATYAYLGLALAERSRNSAAAGAIAAELDAGLNVGTIVVPRFGSGDAHELRRAFQYLLAKHVDMVYADVDLETVADVDAAVDELNRLGFFYSGVMLLGRNGHDQLRLQYENTVDVDEDEIICYSEFAQRIRAYVFEDRRRVAP